MKTKIIVLIMSLVALSCVKKATENRSYMMTDSLESSEIITYTKGDSLVLEEPVFYDVGKIMLFDHALENEKPLLPEFLPLPVEPVK